MISLVVFVVTGIHKILFALRFTVITVSHHQVPVYLFFYSIFGNCKCILALSNIFYDRGIYASLLSHFSCSSILILLTCFYRSLRLHPAFIFLTLIFIKQQNLSTKYNHSATAGCFNHCKPSRCGLKSDFKYTPFGVNLQYLAHFYLLKYTSKICFVTGTADWLPEPPSSTITAMAMSL